MTIKIIKAVSKNNSLALLIFLKMKLPNMINKIKKHWIVSLIIQSQVTVMCL
jgi:hypothetical protein